MFFTYSPQKDYWSNFIDYEIHTNKNYPYKYCRMWGEDGAWDVFNSPIISDDPLNFYFFVWFRPIIEDLLSFFVTMSYIDWPGKC